MKNQNEWVALDADGTIWAYCGPGQNKVLGLVFQLGATHWKYETKAECYSMFSLKTAARMVMDTY